MKNKKRCYFLLTICCAIVVVTLLGVRYLKYKDGVPILGYHHIVSDEEKETYYKHNIYVMSASKFEEQMKYLKEHSYQVLTMNQLYAYYHNELNIQDNSVVLTFDDGLKSFDTVVKPILKKYDLKATCFVIGKKTELKNTQEPGKYTYLRQSDLVNDEYVEYYSHTYNLHHKAGVLKKQMEVESEDFISNDFQKNEAIVSDEFFAFPFGRSSKNARKVLNKRNVKLAFGYGQNRNMLKEDDPYLLPRYIMYDFLPFFAYKWIIA